MLMKCFYDFDIEVVQFPFKCVPLEISKTPKMSKLRKTDKILQHHGGRRSDGRCPVSVSVYSKLFVPCPLLGVLKTLEQH